MRWANHQAFRLFIFSVLVGNRDTVPNGSALTRCRNTVFQSAGAQQSSSVLQRYSTAAEDIQSSTCYISLPLSYGFFPVNAFTARSSFEGNLTNVFWGVVAAFSNPMKFALWPASPGPNLFPLPGMLFPSHFFKWSFLELWPSTVERVQCFHAGILGRELTIVQEVYTSVYSLGKWTVKGYIPRKSVITHWIHHRVRKPWTICWQGEDEDVLRSVFVPALTTY